MRSAHVKKIFLPATVNCIANSKWVVATIVFDEGLNYLLKDALFNVHDVTFSASLTYIDEDAFKFDEDFYDVPTIRAPRNFAAHRFAVKKGYRYMPTDCPVTWNADSWLERFRADGADYRALRREVLENTRTIVEDNGYTLPDGNFVLLTDAKRYSQFYYKAFNFSLERSSTPPEIIVTADECLDAAHKWIKMDYYAPYAERYGVTRSHYQYPLDRDFGGIFSSGVTIFRENETKGYRLTTKTWKVNMIAVASMNKSCLGHNRLRSFSQSAKTRRRTLPRDFMRT
ncbi:MAG: hypothetical protein IJQ82_10910 [Selenomonadaceae bacterium]|nr:hypothetical protein [Selenomonadaceae bacterium]